jgi:hypothetical protein
MTKPFLAITILAALAACGGRGARWESDSAATAKKLEVQVDKRGHPGEIEYHIAPNEVPEVVRRAMDQLHPGGPYDDAEREHEKGVLYFELSRKVNGMDVEAMFAPDGTLHSEEIQVAATKVPVPVQQKAAASLKGATAEKWEEIRNSKREIVAYHVKMSRGGNRYKLMFTSGGELEGIYREVPSEIEVPVEGD